MRQRHSMILTGLALIGAIAFGASGPAQAQVISAFTATPTQINAGETVTFTVTRYGSTKCRAQLKFLDGTPGSPTDEFTMNATTRQFTHIYQTAGTFSPLVKGKSGHSKPPCTFFPPGTQELSVDITVNASEGGTSLQRAPIGDRSLTKVRPRPQRAPETGGLKTIPPKLGKGGERAPLTWMPTVERVIVEPFPGAEPGILAPGAWIIVEGKGFGDEGVVHIDGMPAGIQMYFDTESYSDTRIKAVLSSSQRAEIGRRYPIAIKVIRWADDKKSNLWSLAYERAVDVLALAYDSPAVTLVRCGNLGNVNECNGVSDDGDPCVPGPSSLDPGPVPDPVTLYGEHRNCSATIGPDDGGQDTYEINLKNGWILRDIAFQNRMLSSEKETLDTVTLNKGATSQRIEIDWSVSPGDMVAYRILITATGPVGTLPW